MVVPVDTGTPSSTERLLQRLLREMRKEAGLPQVEVAKRLGKPQSYVSKYERGERRLDVLELRELCRALEVDFVEFAQRLDDELRQVK